MPFPQPVRFKIVSGCQTGADEGGLAAARQCDFDTDGWMPKGFRTDAGPRPDLAKFYGLREHKSADYPMRTRENVLLGDGTLIFGNAMSPGCRLTKKLCHSNFKPVFVYLWISGDRKKNFPAIDIKQFREWLDRHQIHTLNVAGNRENRQPGIREAVFNFLVEALS